MEKLKKYVTLDNAMYLSLFLLGLSTCISEVFSRNMVRTFLILSAIKIIRMPDILWRLRELKGFAIVTGAFMLMMFIEAAYGGRFFEVVVQHQFAFNYAILLIFAIRLTITEKEQINKVLCAMFFSLAVSDIYILYQILVDGYIIVEKYARPLALVGGTIVVTGMMFTMLLPSMVTFILHKGEKQWVRFMAYGAFLLSIFGVIGSYTRASWVTAAIVIVFLMMNYIRSFKKLAVIGMVGVMLFGGVCATVPQVAQRFSSIGDTQDWAQRERYLMWSSAWEMFKDHPFMGVGYGNYTDEYLNNYISPLSNERQTHAHSMYFHYLAEDGLFGFSIYCSMIGYFLWWSWRRRHNIYGMMLFASMLGYCIYSATDYPFGGYEGMRIFWLYIGLCVTGYLVSEQDRSR